MKRTGPVSCRFAKPHFAKPHFAGVELWLKVHRPSTRPSVVSALAKRSLVKRDWRNAMQPLNKVACTSHSPATAQNNSNSMGRLDRAEQRCWRPTDAEENEEDDVDDEFTQSRLDLNVRVLRVNDLTRRPQRCSAHKCTV